MTFISSGGLMSNLVTTGWIPNSTDAADFPRTGLPIIPGGAGQGMDIWGGSGRHNLIGGKARVRVCFVDTLSGGTGLGSLEWACKLNHSADGAEAKTIVPAICGIVDMGNQNPIVMRTNNSGPYVTYAGQCAPNEGLFTYQSAVYVYTYDALLWHYGHIGGKVNTGDTQDGNIVVAGAPGDDTGYVLVANCSGLYARDGNLLVYGDMGTKALEYMGVWQCSWTHSLRYPWQLAPTLTKSRGTNYGSEWNNEHTDNISELRGFYAHNRERHPLEYCQRIELRNNLYFHWLQPVQTQGRGQLEKLNNRDNLYVPMGGEYAMQWLSTATGRALDFLNGSQFYFGENEASHTVPGPAIYYFQGQTPNITQVFSPIAESIAPGYNGTSNVNHLEFATLLTNHAGVKPTMRLDRIQDAVNQCLNRINDTGSGYGGFIDTEDDVGGLPTINPVPIDHTAPTAHGGDPIPEGTLVSAESNGWVADYVINEATGYTELEEWLHRRADDCMPIGWNQ